MRGCAPNWLGGAPAAGASCTLPCSVNSAPAAPLALPMRSSVSPCTSMPTTWVSGWKVPEYTAPVIANRSVAASVLSASATPLRLTLPLASTVPRMSMLRAVSRLASATRTPAVSVKPTRLVPVRLMRPLPASSVDVTTAMPSKNRLAELATAPGWPVAQPLTWPQAMLLPPMTMSPPRLLRVDPLMRTAPPLDVLPSPWPTVPPA